MAQSIPDIGLTRDWISVNASTGFGVGTAMVVQHKGAGRTLYWEGTQPVAGSIDGHVLNLREVSVTRFPAGSLEIWVRAGSFTGKSKIHVSESV